MPLDIESIIYKLANLDKQNVHNNPEFRPLRTKGKLDLDKKDKKKLGISQYYTTDIFGFDPTMKTMYILPLHSKIDDLGVYLKKETKTHIITLNKNLLLEMFKCMK